MRLNRKHREQFSALGLAAPALIGLFVFVVLPLILGGYWSLTDKRLISPLATQWVGLDNYSNLLSVDLVVQVPEQDPEDGSLAVDDSGAAVYSRVRTVLRADSRYAGFAEWFHVDLAGSRYVVIAKDPTFMQAVVNTSVFVLIIVPLQGGLALLLALMVHQRIRGVRLYRSIYFVPVVTSMAVMAVVWTFLYNPQEGLINRALDTVSLGTAGDIPWLEDQATALPAIIILSVWQAVGFQMIIFLAGLQGIAEDLYDAAKVDGAGRRARFRHVTVPGLRNTIIFVVISTTVLAFRLFTQVDVMTKGGPQDSTVTIIFQAVQAGFREQRIGYASAIVVTFFLIVLVIAVIQRRLLPSERAIEDA